MTLILLVSDEVQFVSASGSANWRSELVDSPENVINPTSLDFDVNGYPHIAYRDGSAGGILKYAYFDGGSWHTEVIHNVTNSGFMLNLVLDSNGMPHAAWRYSGSHKSVMYAYRDNAGWHIETIHMDSWPKSISLALDSLNRPHLSYWTDGGDDLTHAWRDETSWHREVVKATSHYLTTASIAIDSADRPHIAYKPKVDPKVKTTKRPK